MVTSTYSPQGRVEGIEGSYVRYPLWPLLCLLDGNLKCNNHMPYAPHCCLPWVPLWHWKLRLHREVVLTLPT